MNEFIEIIQHKWIEIIYAAFVGLVVQIYLNYRNNKKSKKAKLIESLSLLYSYVYEAKEYWFMIIEFSYLWQYFKISPKHNSYNDQIILNYEDFEKYRLKLVELDTKIFCDLAMIKSIDHKLEKILKKRINRLVLRGRGIPEFKLDMNKLVDRNRTPLGISHLLQNHFYKEKELGHQFMSVLREISSHLDRIEKR